MSGDVLPAPTARTAPVQYRARFAYPGRPLLACAMLLVAFVVSADARVPVNTTVKLHQWTSLDDFRAGTPEGTRWDGGIVLDRPVSTVPAPGASAPARVYEWASWTSPSVPAVSGATQLVPSWNARTPPGTWLRVEMRGHTSTGERTKWYSFGPWASDDRYIQRTSVAGQADDRGDVDVDTFAARAGTALVDYQLRVTLYRAAGTAATPTVTRLAAMTSAVPDRFGVPPSGGGVAWGRELAVPRYSQNVHKGHFPQYGGGGEAWCSPTSTEMVIEYWGRRPGPAELAWIGAGHPDPTVDYAARHTFDAAYQGTGNWAFNAAYAGTFGLDAHVTRLRSLDDAERYIAAGIPVITSQAFQGNEISGTHYDTDGHLMVIVGFTAHGDVIVNDPASDGDAAVRHVYPRRQFENVWLRTKRHTADGKVADGSGGIAYIIAPPGHPQPE